MAKVFMKSGTGEDLNVLGMPLTFLCDASETGDAWSLIEEDIGLGQGPTPHRHNWNEAYYVISGVVNFVVDGEKYRAESGDFINIPKNAVHAFKGGSDTLSRVLIFSVPAHSSAFFRDVNREIRVPEDVSKMPEIGQRHGIEFLPALN